MDSRESPGSRGTEGVAAAYDRWALSYDRDRNPTRDLTAAVLRGGVIDPRGRVVLEIGCGTGANTEWLAERAAHVIALDFSLAMLERARERVSSPRVEFISHDICQPWPIADGSVDLVVGTLVLEHVDALEPIFRQAYRVLRGGGECFVCELHPFRQLAGGQAQFVDRDTAEAVRVTAFLHDVGDYVNAAVAAGFRILATDDWRDRPDSPRRDPPRLFSVRGRRDA